MATKVSNPIALYIPTPTNAIVSGTCPRCVAICNGAATGSVGGPWGVATGTGKGADTGDGIWIGDGMVGGAETGSVGGTGVGGVDGEAIGPEMCRCKVLS